jgi:hypothetical protein
VDDIRSYATVQNWLEKNKQKVFSPVRVNMDDKLEILEKYLDFIGVDPDTFIAVSSDLVEGGTKTRNGYLKELKRWVRSLELPTGAATRTENVVRGFLIANAIKVMTKPYEDVYRRHTGGQASPQRGGV